MRSNTTALICKDACDVAKERTVSWSVFRLAVASAYTIMHCHTRSVKVSAQEWSSMLPSAATAQPGTTVHNTVLNGTAFARPGPTCLSEYDV